MAAGKTVVAPVLVTGDVRIDWLIARELAGRPLVRFVKQPGGAALLAKVFSHLAGATPVIDPAASLPDDLETIDPGEVPHTAAELDRFPRVAGSTQTPHDPYRIRQFLDVHSPADRRADALHDGRDAGRRATGAVVEPGCALALVDDLGTGFRAREPSPALLACRDVVLATRWPLEKAQEANRLWPALKGARERSGGRLAVILNVSYLRAAGLQISRGLSWQKTVGEIVDHFAARALDGASDVLLRLGQEAVLHWSDTTGEWLFSFYPDRAEDHCKERHPGDMLGAHAVFAADVAHALLEGRDIADGVKRGIADACEWHAAGFGADFASVGYPLGAIAPGRPVRTEAIESARIDRRYRATPFFLLQDLAERDARFDVARDVVRTGPSVLGRLPRAVFKDVVWIDPREVEAYRNVAALASEYLKRAGTKPLSIAVFGPPGAGKSFGIKTVAGTIGRMEPLEFNLSQWSAPERLATAFHRIREVSISGRTPLAFFDEFDSSLGDQALGWLKYFLAPMNDGKFRDGEFDYSLGRCLLVFAGSTSHTFEQFQARCVEDTPEIARAKARDFLSRLRGYVNVLGPGAVGGPDGKARDPLYVVRRALVLRSTLERNAPGLVTRGRVNIDDRVLVRLLREDYGHGARSIDAILEMSRLAGKSAFGLADLPPEEQLGVHLAPSEE